MGVILAFLSLVGLCSLHAVLGVDISTTLTKPMPTGDTVLVEKFALPNITMITPVHRTASSTRIAIPTTIRNKRQIAYGALGSGMASGLSGISSGYGYGYNNAVGLQGQGMGHGSGTQMAPLFGGGIGGMGMMGGLGYGALPVGGNIGALGMAGLNGGYGPVGYGGGVVPVGGMGSGLMAQGAGGAGWSGGAAPITSAIVPTTGGAYGRSDDVPVFAPLDTQSVPLNTQSVPLNTRSDVAGSQPVNTSTQG